MIYQLTRLRARTKNTQPTLTDQSGAKDTDINIIVKQFLGTGQAPGNAQTPMHADFTQYPEDLRRIHRSGTQTPEHIGKLPPELKGLTLDELTHLQTRELLAKLVPDAKKPPDTSGNSTKPPVG